MPSSCLPRLRIALILPRASPRPVGAIKIIYEHADRLTARGHAVTVVHLSRTAGITAIDDDTVGGWFTFRHPVTILSVPAITRYWITGTFDVTVATAWQIAPEVAALPPYTGRKVFFLQDYESYLLGSAEERAAMERAMTLPWPLIACSKPVERLVAKVPRRQCLRIPCTIDTGTFAIDNPIDSPKRTLIGFPARPEEAKRTSDAVTALELVRSRLPDQPLSAWCFGPYAPTPLPPWITHHSAPEDRELRRLYNRSAIFVVPSLHEGFGLPGAEAMACGAALVSTRNGGVSAYATHGKSAWLCPARSPCALAEATIRLLTNPGLRHRLANAGARRIARHRPELATDAFEAALQAVACGDVIPDPSSGGRVDSRQ